MRRTHERADRLISGFDRSPFVHVFTAVTLVLLLILMVNAPPLHEYLGLPRVNHPIPMWHAANRDAVLIRVNYRGRISLANEELTADQLAVGIRTRMKQCADKRVYILADSVTKYEAIKRVLDAIRDAGVEHVSFIVHES